MIKKISILEDDQDIREICAYLFTSEGYEVDSYATVGAFCQNLTIPDLYLLDIRLPDGNGMEVCHKLKTNPRSQKVPIIMMSAHMDSPTVRARCTAEAFISKPFLIDEMLDRAKLLIATAKK